MQPIIGILAGMGPRSTGPFLDLIVDECQRQYGAREIVAEWLRRRADGGAPGSSSDL
jgi:aspartate/glutamate racemase